MKRLLLALLLLAFVPGRAPAGEIHNAVYNNDLEAVRKLLAADPTLVNSPQKGYRKATPLMHAVMKNSNEMALFLISAGADVNQGDSVGKRPLHLAVEAGNLELVKTLLDHGADVKIKTGRGATPLHILPAENAVPIYQELIEHGADVNAMDEDGVTPLVGAVILAGYPYNQSLVTDPRSPPVRFLFEHGAGLGPGDEVHLAILDGDLELLKVLLQIEPSALDRNDRFIFGEPPLSLAIATANQDITRYLLEAGAGVEVADAYGDRPLHYAARTDQPDVAARLIEKGATIDPTDAKLFTPLHYAAAYSYQTMVLLIDKGAKLNARSVDWLHSMESRDPYNTPGYARIYQGILINDLDLSEEARKELVESGAGNTPLYLATMLGRWPTMKKLLDRGADPNIKGKLGNTPLHAAVGDRKGLPRGPLQAKLLIAAGADVNAAQEDESTPLLVAVRDDNFETAKLLLEKGAKVDAENQWRAWPLGEASSARMVELLLAHGADIDKRGKWGSRSNQTALVLATEPYRKPELFEVLLKHGADFKGADEYGQTLLHQLMGPEYEKAALENQVKYAGLLIGKGADVNARDEDGHTPLHLAKANNFAEMVKLLEKAGARRGKEEAIFEQAEQGDLAKVKAMIGRDRSLLSSRDVLVDNSTLLDLAARYGHKELADYLIGEGISVGDTAGKCRTPFRVACEYGRVEVAKLLLEKGAVLRPILNSAFLYCGDETPMLLAAANGHREIVDLLIAHGDTQYTQGLEAATRGGHEDLAVFFIEKGAKFRIELGPQGEEAAILHMALQDFAKATKALIEHGASLTAHTHYDCRLALDLAITLGHVEVVKTLLEYGALKHSTYLPGCRWYGKGLMDPTLPEKNLEIVKALVEHGFDANRPYDRPGDSLLHFAASIHDPRMAEWLIGKGADVNLRDNDGVTPLDRALNDEPEIFADRHDDRGAEEMAAFLVGRGADVKARDGDNETPLHRAAGHGLIKAVRLLAGKGAEVDARDRRGETPLQWAARGGELGAVRALVELGADVNARSDRGATALELAAEAGRKDVVAYLLGRKAFIDPRKSYLVSELEALEP